MKKVFMPSMDELYEMQDRGANIYKYLLVKTVESMIVDGINFPFRGKLANAPSYLRENQYIAPAICTMYPEEIKHSKVAQTDINLCLKLLENKENINCGLDTLAEFDSLVFINNTVIEKTITKLEEELRRNPKYRFEYKESILLKKILHRQITDSDLIVSRHLAPKLVNIEPAYGISLSDYQFDKSRYEKNIRMCAAINSLGDSYGIPSYVGSEYLGKDILTQQPTEVKKLIKSIKKINK